MARKIAQLRDEAFGRLLPLGVVTVSYMLLFANLEWRFTLPWLLKWTAWVGIWGFFLALLIGILRIESQTFGSEPVADLSHEVVRRRWPRNLVMGLLTVIWIAHAVVGLFPLSFKERASLASVEGAVANRGKYQGETYITLANHKGNKLWICRAFAAEAASIDIGVNVLALTDGSSIVEARTPQDVFFTYEEYQARLLRDDRYNWTGPLVVTCVVLIVWFRPMLSGNRQASGSTS